MRVKTELSEQPPVFAVSREKQRAVITFYTDVERLEREEGEAWSAVAWTMYGTWADGLEARIAAHPDAWFRTVRDRCIVEEQAAKIEESKLTIEDLTGAVLELGELLAEQDDALVELAELIEEGV